MEALTCARRGVHVCVLKFVDKIVHVCVLTFVDGNKGQPSRNNDELWSGCLNPTSMLHSDHGFKKSSKTDWLVLNNQNLRNFDNNKIRKTRR
jgi:hypothetical protein